ncbi:MAG: nitroreductase [Burkholderiaceae bacterium]|jgi:nitroreductase|nr:MAG: nitroreductase [Burkholderiaceae bacterium]TBR72919.1 MAG: nitroreductase [Burkholderiaceae bacterium]
MSDLEQDTVVRSISGEAVRRRTAQVAEWRIEKEIESDGVVMSVVTPDGMRRSLRIEAMDAQDIGEVLRQQAGPVDLNADAASEAVGVARGLGGLLARRSVSPRRLQTPGPDAAELDRLIQAGLRAPDHGGLHPWRIIEFRARSRATLARCFEQEKLRRDPLASAIDLKRAREHATLAPVLLGFVVAPRQLSKVPLREQWLGAGAALGNILNAAHQLGFGAIVLSGERCFDAILVRQLGLSETEFLAGFISLGTIAETPPPARQKLSQDVWSCWMGHELPDLIEGDPSFRQTRP